MRYERSAHTETRERGYKDILEGMWKRLSVFLLAKEEANA